MTAAGRVYVVLVNYNGWRDTVECLESLLRSDYPDFRVLVCDNGSPNDSLVRLLAWVDGRESGSFVSGPMRQYSDPQLPKPISHILRSADEPLGVPTDVPVTFIQIHENRGFAGGCNVGMRYALADPAAQFIWLLNNDAVVTPSTLSRVVDKLRATPSAGMCGSSLLFYDRPEVVQAAGGGILNKWTGTTRGYAAFRALASIGEAETIRRLDYIAGAALLVTRRFLENVGLMNEDYFLYYEELDWACRARHRFTLAYAKDSIVYHKEGGSIGTSSDPTQRSPLADRYGVINRIRFMCRFFPYALPTVYLALLGAIFNRIRRRQYDRIPMILRAMFGL